jgi:hypothetical protein
MRDVATEEMGETVTTGVSRTVLLIEYYLSDKIKKNEMCAECNTYGRRISAYKNFFLEGGSPRKRDYLEDLGIDGGVILKWIFRNRMCCLDWIWFMIGRDEACCESGDKLSVSIT